MQNSPLPFHLPPPNFTTLPSKIETNCMTTTDYLTRIMLHHSAGRATEHTFRGDLQTLIESIAPHIRATNEPKRQRCGGQLFGF